MNDSNNRKIGAILSYVSIIANTLIQLIYTPFLIKSLGQGEYGLYSLINSVIGYLTILDLGFGNAIVVYTAKYRVQKKFDDEKRLHGMFFVIFCIIGFIAGVLGIVLFLNVDKLFGATMSSLELRKAKIMMLILTFNLIISFIFSIYSSILNAYEKFVYQKIVNILGMILKPIIMIPFLFLGYKSISMVLIITFVNIFTLLSNYLYCRKRLNISIKFYGFDRNLFKTIFGYSIWLFLGSVVDKVNWSVDQFVLGSVSGTIAVSIYSVASTLNTLFLNLSTALSSVFLPKITKMVANNATSKQLTNEMIKVGRIQYIILFLACSGLVLFGKEFIIWWVGDKFVQSYYVALILIIPLCFPLIQNIGISIMQAMNRYKFKSISTFIMAVFNVFISIFLAMKYGAIGSAIGTAISLIVCNIIIINFYYYKAIKINIFSFWKEIILMSVPFIIPVLLIVFLMNIFVIKGIMSVIVYGCLYSIFYLIVCYCFSMSEYEKSIIINIFNKVYKRRKKNA